MNSNQPLETENIHSQHVQVPVVYLRGGNNDFFFNLERLSQDSRKALARLSEGSLEALLLYEGTVDGGAISSGSLK